MGTGSKYLQRDNKNSVTTGSGLENSVLLGPSIANESVPRLPLQ